MSDTRLEKRLSDLSQKQEKAFVAFITAGDPDEATSQKILEGLAAHADIIELGMPFTDPMADGPSIQHASQRALAAGMSVEKTLQMVTRFRETNQDTPIVLMGYYNPVYIFGVERFLDQAKTAGVDGLIIVDLPPEEDEELCLPALNAGLNFIRLATPTTDDKRLPEVLANTSGFVYYVSITGITGSSVPQQQQVTQAVQRIKNHTELPICIGFGIKTPEAAKEFAQAADGVVVGSALVDQIKNSLDDKGQAGPDTIGRVIKLAEELAQGVKQA